jgi:hypothetical protein
MLGPLKLILKKLDSELSAESQAEIFNCHLRALNWEETVRLPLLITFPYPAESVFHPFPHHEALMDPEKMLFNELVHAFDTSILLHDQIKDDLSYTVRANYGTVIIASLFGGKVEQRADNPPWVRHYETKDSLRTIFDKDPLDFTAGYVSKVLETYKFYNQVFSEYPNLKKCVKMVLPDLQGPLDSLELLWGSEIYSEFITDPELVDKGLEMMAKAQAGLAKHLLHFTTDEHQGFTHQHATTIKGNILIRNDSAIMISPEMYTQQVAPHDESVLKEMNGGGIHSCGNIDFNIPEIFRLNSIKCFDFGQSWLNDLDSVYSLARELKIPLIRIRVEKDELLSGRISKRFPTGVSLFYNAASFEEALSVSKQYNDLFRYQ